MFLPKPKCLLLSVAFMVSCKESADQLPVVTTETFDRIQTDILTPTCAIAGCHASESDPSFAEHHLVLERSVAFANLVNVSSYNPNALAAGLLRVKPFDPDGSLLLHKLHLNNHHTEDFGNPMPLGLLKLSVGRVEYIQQWIASGAPRTGSVADVALLADETRQEEMFEPLPPPEAGKGFQVSVSRFPVAPNFERELFVYKTIGNSADVFVNRIEVKMRTNSHHLVVYDFREDSPPYIFPALDVLRDIRNPDNSLNSINMVPMLYHTFFFGAQSPYANFEFPAGVALRMTGGKRLDFNSHYVNKEPEPISGEVNVNFYTIPEVTVVNEAQAINLGNTSIRLNPGERKTIAKTFTFSEARSLVALTSHTHELGEKFIIRIAGGVRNNEIIYTGSDWHHPPFITFDPPIQLLPGEGLMSEITYYNTRSSIVVFGLTSQDEMGIIFGYYY